MSIEIRKMSESDVSGVIALLHEFAEFENLGEFCQVTQEKLLAAMFGEGAFVEGLIAHDGETPVGYALFYPCFASFRGQRGVFLEDIYVMADYRRHSLGLAMLKEIAKTARARGFERIDFQVLNWNTPAIKFYKKHGAVSDADEQHFKFTGSAFDQLTS